VCQGPFPWG